MTAYILLTLYYKKHIFEVLTQHIRFYQKPNDAYYYLYIYILSNIVTNIVKIIDIKFL